MISLLLIFIFFLPLMYLPSVVYYAFVNVDV